MAKAELTDIRACVFDAYGTLFDFYNAAARCKDDLDGKWEQFSALWRAKQMEYTWLRSLMGDYHVDFWEVTGAGLDFALGSLGFDDPALRKRLMNLYLELETFPEVKAMLVRLKDAGMKTAILSNGSPRMLEAAAKNAGIDHLLDALLSVEQVGVYKPHPSVYQMTVDWLGLPAATICYQSSNAWDAYCSAAFGYQVVWINRYRQRPEGLPGAIRKEIFTLTDLPVLAGA
ncbi:MAG: haloacid dehalogenase type II [Alphaproteobacteria bacterium]